MPRTLKKVWILTTPVSMIGTHYSLEKQKIHANTQQEHIFKGLKLADIQPTKRRTRLQKLFEAFTDWEIKTQFCLEKL